MRLFRNLVFILVSICSFLLEASISLTFKFTEQSYWYGKAGNGDPGIPFNIINGAYDDLCSKMSSAELLCFLSGILRNDHPILNELILWNYVKSEKLEIPKKDEVSIKADNLKFKLTLEKNIYLLEKIKKFWGVKVNKNIHIHCFFSRLDDKQLYFNGECLKNFVYGNDIHAICLMCIPPLVYKAISLNKHLCVIAHEFSHSMCDASFGRENFEVIVSKIQSPNAVIASWYLDEALATILGNGLIQEILSKKKIDLRKEEYCTRGFASALYDLTKDYFDNAKAIDESFLENAVKIFDKVHPNGYKDPNMCLVNVFAICPYKNDGDEIKAKLSKRTYISSFGWAQLPLTSEGIEIVKNFSHTILVIFRDKKQLESLKNVLLPSFDDKKPIDIVHKDRRTFIFIKIDDKHSIDDRINELFSGNYCSSK